jgi:hypothetical protein
MKSLHFDDVRDVGGSVALTVNAGPCRRPAGVVALPGAELHPGVGLRALERQKRRSCITIITVTVKEILNTVCSIDDVRLGFTLNRNYFGHGRGPKAIAAMALQLNELGHGNAQDSTGNSTTIIMIICCFRTPSEWRYFLLPRPVGH